MRLTVLVAMLASFSALAQSQWIDDCGLVPPGSEPWPPVPTRPWEPTVGPNDPPVVARVREHVHRNGGLPTANYSLTGALAGKTVYLSPGPRLHLERRHPERLADAAGQHQLHRRGSRLRRDARSVPHAHAAQRRRARGAGARDRSPPPRWPSSTTPTWARATRRRRRASPTRRSPASGARPASPPRPWTAPRNPFTLAKNRLMTAASTDTASATYSATLPASGFYNVYVSYSRLHRPGDRRALRREARRRRDRTSG